MELKIMDGVLPPPHAPSEGLEPGPGTPGMASPKGRQAVQLQGGRFPGQGLRFWQSTLYPFGKSHHSRTVNFLIPFHAMIFFKCFHTHGDRFKFAAACIVLL